MPEGNKIRSDFSCDTGNGLLEGNHYSYFKNYSFFHQIQFYNPAYSIICALPCRFCENCKIGAMNVRSVNLTSHPVSRSSHLQWKLKKKTFSETPFTQNTVFTLIFMQNVTICCDNCKKWSKMAILTHVALWRRWLEPKFFSKWMILTYMVE